MNLAKRKLLTEYLKECWHENVEVHPYPDHPEEFYSRCRTCNIEEYHENRTFTTPDDFFTLKDKLVEKGEWMKFEEFSIRRWVNETRATGDPRHTDWLLNASRFCELVGEWLGGRKP